MRIERMRGACREQKLKPLTRQQGEQSPKRLFSREKAEP
jgi:hypothetical protein